MTTLPIQAPLLPRLWALPSAALARAGAAAMLVLDVFDEAQQQAREMHRRYPFVNW